MGRLRIATAAMVAAGTVVVAGGCVQPPPAGPPVYPDSDHDGFTADVDCRDDDPAVNPAASDGLGDEIDNNCDGVDGVVTDSVFVRGLTGRDTPTCGEIVQPCRSIQRGEERAVELVRQFVRVAGGVYDRFTVRPGIWVVGGYGQNFRDGRYATAPTQTEVRASMDPAVGAPWAVRATDVTGGVVTRMLLTGIPAPAGSPSYVVLAERAQWTAFIDVTVAGGTGGAGAAGVNGTNAPAPGTNMNGEVGGNSHEDGASCDHSTSGRGGAGGNQVSSTAYNGSAGGAGGVQDDGCPFSYDALAGQPGNPNNGLDGGTSGWAARDCLDHYGRGLGKAQNGGPGARGSDGRDGVAGLAADPTLGQIVAGRWQPRTTFFVGTGTPGFLGTGGSGGSGGGGGGGSDCGDDDWGGGGGGGGAGGLPAPVAGTGGAQGAASVAFLLVDSIINTTNVDVVVGTGGAGGRGGNSGAGQAGGTGGAGGLADCDGDAGAFGPCQPTGQGGGGGRGGDGGRGGHAGGGGGGAGGAAIGIWMANSNYAGTTSFVGGNGGPGGPGGGGPNPGAAGRLGIVQNEVSS